MLHSKSNDAVVQKYIEQTITMEAISYSICAYAITGDYDGMKAVEETLPYMSPSERKVFARDLESGMASSAIPLLGKELDISIRKLMRKGYTEEQACDQCASDTMGEYIDAAKRWDRLRQSAPPAA